jgi:ectoine hydroxylase-related dioxygenase (phytanoyl-CoA dioxygenase family)
VSLSPRQRDEFRELGFFHLGRVFDHAELEEIRSEYDRCLGRSPLRIAEEGRHPFEFSPLLQLQSAALCRHAASPRLLEVAIELLGPDVRLYWDQAVCKPPGADSDVPWHQDNGYAPVVPEEYLTFTVALDATTVENGCLWIQPGSHRGGVVPHRPTDAFFYRGYQGERTGVPVPQPEGDVLCFSSLVLHRTGGNRTRARRRSWVIQHCRADTRHGETGVLLDDRLLVARDGRPLPEPVRERPFDLAGLLRAEAAARRR